MRLLQTSIAALNRLPLWHRRVRVGPDMFRATSLDRLAYLWKQKQAARGNPERDFFAQQLKPGMHVVDAGANLGVYSHLFAHLVGPAGRVVAFEPDPTLQASLVENIRANGLAQIHPQCLALGARSASASLQRGTLNSGDNRLVVVPIAGRAAPTTVVTLDDFLAGQPVDFIKMDIQGWELHALEGMSRTLAANPRIQLYVELWPYGLKLNGQTPEELLGFLTRQGFRCDFFPAALRSAQLDYRKLAQKELWYADLHVYRE